MKLICCGSGSLGNTYLLTDGYETLVLDCGIRFLDVKKALNFQVRGIVGAVVSHVHGDHHAFAHEYVNAGIRVWEPYKSEILRHDMRFGTFKVTCFPLVHNVPCRGFLIEHEKLGKMVYITDTEYCQYTFEGLSTILVEANYDTTHLNRKDAKTKHVLTGHQSLQTAMSFIEANKSDNLNHIILCHLSSSGNIDADEALEVVREIAPAGCTVDLAERGVTVDLGDAPF